MMDEDALKRLKTMDAQAYKVWSELHRRRVLGEPMSEVEEATYEAGCQEIDATVRYDGSLAYYEQLLTRMDAVEAKLQQQREQEAALNARITALERELAEERMQSPQDGN